MKKKLKSFLKKLKAFDLIVIIFFILLSIINIIYRNDVPQWRIFLVYNTGIILFTFMVAYFEDKYNNAFWRILHYWYIAPLILFTFKEIYFMIKPIRKHDYDYLFIEIDRMIFGGDPTVFMYQFANPVITEILQIVYGLFYFLPIILALFLLKYKRYLAVDFTVFSVVYGFYLSYLGYFALPGVGPRFTLHDFELLNTELPGLFLTNYLRELTNIGESIPTGTPNPLEVVQRDIFPSGHTMITLIVMYLALRFRSKVNYFLIPVGTLLIISTVYLRYHYVIDLVGGAAFAAFSLWTGKFIFNWWRRKVGKEELDYSKV
jgi:membrane-associated phospholipid phosphatase